MTEGTTKILVVEDDATIARLVELELEHAGFTVMKVGDGVAAVAAVQEYDPDLILLDLMLPGMDGLEVTRTLRFQGSTVPILMLTARSETQDVVTGFDAGADDYLRKPFEIPELLSRVRALLKRVEHDKPGTQYKVGDIEIDPDSTKRDRWGRAGDRHCERVRPARVLRGQRGARHQP